MSLFRCSHYVPIKDMKDIKLQYDSFGGVKSLQHCSVITYQGFCRECNAFVSIREELENRALYEYLRREEKKR
jgi:hypothetical protein